MKINLLLPAPINASFSILLGIRVDGVMKAFDGPWSVISLSLILALILTSCEIVPGVDDKTDDTKALELAAKYILFLKTRVNLLDHDKEFLRKQII